MWADEGAGRGLDGAGDAPPSLHILLAEDDTPSLCILNRLLTACGYRVSLARNGREALHLLDSDASVDLVLSDVLMPEVSGIELLGQVVQRDKLRGVPVVVMSSESSTDFIASALQAGAADYLIKPVQRSAVTMLWQHVWRITSCRAGLREAAWSEDSSARSGTAASSSDEFQGLAAPSGVEQSAAESGCSCPDSWEAPRRSASLPAQPGALWRPRAGKGARGGSFDLHRVRAPALLPCMRVSLEIEPLDLTPRSVLDFSALASPRAGREEADAAPAAHHGFLPATAHAPAAAAKVGGAPGQKSFECVCLSVTCGLSLPMRICSRKDMKQAEGGDAAAWAANRRAAIEKFRAKRKLRKYIKCVRYESRRRLAEARPRVRGMFVKADVAAAYAAEQAAVGGAKRGPGRRLGA